jgi:putative lipoic acid-binding regulatory protein
MPGGVGSGENPQGGDGSAPVRGSRTAPARELLLANHEFPGEYVIKAFGPADASFREGVGRAVRATVGDRCVFSERTTRAGKTVCVTAELQVESVDEVISIYELLHELETLKLIL